MNRTLLSFIKHVRSLSSGPVLYVQRLADR